MNNYEKTSLEDLLLAPSQSQEDAYIEMFNYIGDYCSSRVIHYVDDP